MDAREKEKNNKKKTRRRYSRYYRGKATQTSMHFLLWSVFALFAILILVSFGVTQYVTMVRSYKEEVSREVWRKGSLIQAVWQNPPESFGKNQSYYVQFLSDKHDVRTTTC